MYRGLLLLASAVVAAPQAEDGEVVTRLQLVTLRGDECRAGSCHTAAECGAAGGEEGGSCAGGFGVCCVGHQEDTADSSARNRKRSKEKRRIKRESVVFLGNSCQYINFKTVRRLGAGCVDGTKMVVKNRPRINRKHSIIADNNTIYAFAAQVEQFPNCKNFTEKTRKIKCKAVEGLSSVSLSGSRRRNIKISGDRVYTGGNCEWIDLNEVILYLFQIIDDNSSDQTF